ncbi:MAG: ABC transporter ATP-binding protein [Actinobacteria bacterium]|nr:ABC transporter ATP-binding protein [Actinomycetota bacterium]
MNQPRGSSSPAASYRQVTGPIVEARGVVKTYRRGQTEVQALRGTDLAVDRGEMVAVVGPSGSGKTTLLNCLSGLDDVDEGQVLVAGRDIHQMSDRERTAFRGRAMGFIFQAFNLVPVFSAAENVELPLLLGDAGPDEARRRAEEVLAQVGLADRVDHRPAELSGGEQQRVAIARALAPQPEIVWTDEPTGNLDSATAGDVMELLHGLNAEGLTIVLVTHDETIARRADRLLTMHDGRIVDEQARA